MRNQVMRIALVVAASSLGAPAPMARAQETRMGPSGLRQALLNHMPGIASNPAYSMTLTLDQVKVPAVADIARRLGNILTAPAPEDPEFAGKFHDFQERLVTDLLDTWKEKGLPEQADEKSLAQALLDHARKLNAQAQGMAPAIWAAPEIAPERLASLAERARDLGRLGAPFLAAENARQLKTIVTTAEKQSAQVLALGIHRARQIARDLQEALRSEGIPQPSITQWSDQASDLKNWLVGDTLIPAVPTEGTKPDPDKLESARLKHKSTKNRQDSGLLDHATVADALFSLLPKGDYELIDRGDHVAIQNEETGEPLFLIFKEQIDYGMISIYVLPGSKGFLSVAGLAGAGLVVARGGMPGVYFIHPRFIPPPPPMDPS